MQILGRCLEGCWLTITLVGAGILQAFDTLTGPAIPYDNLYPFAYEDIKYQVAARGMDR
jgi:hypothetical protein